MRCGRGNCVPVHYTGDCFSDDMDQKMCSGMISSNCKSHFHVYPPTAKGPPHAELCQKHRWERQISAGGEALLNNIVKNVLQADKVNKAARPIQPTRKDFDAILMAYPSFDLQASIQFLHASQHNQHQFYANASIYPQTEMGSYMARFLYYFLLIDAKKIML
jgi:hypothetical protein